MTLPEGSAQLDTDRMDADFENKCRIWIQAYRAHFGDRQAAILRHAALADFIDCVASYIGAKGEEPLHRHDAVVQAKATIQYLEKDQDIRSVLIEEFYYGLVMKLLDQQYGNSRPRSAIDDEIAQVRAQLKRVS